MTLAQTQPYLYPISGQWLLPEPQPQPILYETGHNPYHDILPAFPHDFQQGLIPNGDLMLCAAIVTFSGIRKLVRDNKFARRDRNILDRIEQEMRGRDRVVEPEREYDEHGDVKHGLYYEDDAHGRPATLNCYTWGARDGVSVNFGYGGAVENFEFHDKGVKIESLSRLLTSRKPRRFTLNPAQPEVNKECALKDMRKAARGLVYETQQLVLHADGSASYQRNSIDLTQNWGHHWNMAGIRNQPPGYRRFSMSDHKFH